MIVGHRPEHARIRPVRPLLLAAVEVSEIAHALRAQRAGVLGGEVDLDEPAVFECTRPDPHEEIGLDPLAAERPEEGAVGCRLLLHLDELEDAAGVSDVEVDN